MRDGHREVQDHARRRLCPLHDGDAQSWRPAVAWPAELAQEDRHFSSGVNNAGEVRGLAMSGRHFMRASADTACAAARTGLGAFARAAG